MRRPLLTLLAGVLVLLAAASPATAHVTVAAPGATAGEAATVTLTVPGELAGRATVRVELLFPSDPAVAEATVPGKSGWTAEVTREGDAVGSIVWSGGRIPPRGTDSFRFEVASMPAGELRFVALQEYDNGEVVRWEGAEAPALSVEGSAATAAPGATSTSASGPGATSTTAAAPSTTAAPPADGGGGDDDGLGATDVVFLALAVAGVGGGLALALLRRRPRGTAGG